MESIIFKFEKIFNNPISGRRKFQFFAIFSLSEKFFLVTCEFETERVHSIYKLLHLTLVSNVE